MNQRLSRRHFFVTVTGAIAALSLARNGRSEEKPAPFKISLAEWSLHRALFTKKLSNLDFPRVAKSEFGIEAVEYVNQFWMDKAKDATYLDELKKITAGEGITNVLIMCDSEGDLGDPDEKKRRRAVENHFKWVEAGKTLGCHSIRVNARSSGTYDEQMERAADGLRQLAQFGAQHGLNIIVENHGGLSSLRRGGTIFYRSKQREQTFQELLAKDNPIAPSTQRAVAGFSSGSAMRRSKGFRSIASSTSSSVTSKMRLFLTLNCT